MSASLVNGVKVEASVLKSGNQLQAQKIEIKGRASTLEVKGAVSDFVSVSDFKVAGQKTDASKAEFNDGKSSDLASGRVVEVKGALNNGVLIATKVSFDD
ncbi:DUF5666 domain-containing protein [Iodobacter ciconiae]|uniref:DUF5666 domain-containing protein n=1 Tax=Iodobacter ciconiae TaxID=2496266 RepID=A0A3S8ZSP7_9NEIS|nr:DUF5666 domain-containing protein [Iodobacter ciconiae]AZN36441.1 hypothetical protein EJO50_08020 [Iodobacter ciconiae]